MLDHFYKQIAPGTINKNHMFWVDKSAPTTLHLKEWTEGIASSQNLILGKDSTEERREAMRSYAFKGLKPPGLSELKQVDLYLKYRPFIPPEHQDEICPRPSDEVMEKIKKERNEKQRGKASDKRALQTEANAAKKAKSEEEKATKKAKVAEEKELKEAAKELKAQQKMKAAEEKAAKEAAKQLKAQEKTRAAEEKAKKAAAKKDEREKKAAATSVSAAAVASALDNRKISHLSEENVEASVLDNRAQEEDWPMSLDNRSKEEDWPILLDEVRVCCCGDNCKNQNEEEEPEYFCHTCGKYSHYMCSSVINGVCTCNQCALGI
jgi:flagellar biosynthesis GTPase FlhF